MTYNSHHVKHGNVLTPTIVRFTSPRVLPPARTDHDAPALSLSLPLPFLATTLSSPCPSLSLPLPFPRHRPFLAFVPRRNWCSQVQSKPTVTWEAEEGKLYTLVMTDPDAPTRSDPKWGEWYARRLHPPDFSRLCALT